MKFKDKHNGEVKNLDLELSCDNSSHTPAFLDWQLSLVDLLALLLTMFTLIFSMSGTKPPPPPSPASSPELYQTLSLKDAEMVHGHSLNYLHSLLANHLKERPEFKELKLKIFDGQLVLTVPLNFPALAKVAELFKYTPNQIIIRVPTASVTRENIEKNLKLAADFRDFFTNSGYDKPIKIQTNAKNIENSDFRAGFNVIILPLDKERGWHF